MVTLPSKKGESLHSYAIATAKNCGIITVICSKVISSYYKIINDIVPMTYVLCTSIYFSQKTDTERVPEESASGGPQPGERLWPM